MEVEVMKRLLKLLLMCVLYGYSIVLSHSQLRHGVRVIILHGVEPDEMDRLDKLINRLTRKWRLITPQEFLSFLNGNLELDKPSILVTFDDGFETSALAEKKVLSKYKVKSIFFIATDFIKSGTNGCSEIFVKNNLLLSESECRQTSTDPMNLDSISYLLSNDNIIGSHTVSHARLSNLDKKNIIDELKESKFFIDKLITQENKTEKTSEFAFPFGDISSISNESLILASRHYERVYTGCRGVNKSGMNIIYRDSISLKDPMFFSDIYLSGVLDKFYQRKFNSLLSNNRS